MSDNQYVIMNIPLAVAPLKSAYRAIYASEAVQSVIAPCLLIRFPLNENPNAYEPAPDFFVPVAV